MNRLGKVILAGLLLIGSADVKAQGERKPYFQLNTGFSIPVSETLSEFWGSGLGLGIGAGYVLNQKFTILASLDYNRFKINEDKFLTLEGLDTSVASIEKGGITTFSAFAEAKMGGVRREDLRMVPYVIAGLGFFRFKSDDVIQVIPIIGPPELKRTAVTESDFGVSAGGGVNIRLTDRFDLYLEGGLVIGFLPGSSTQLFPVKLGLALQ